MQEVLLGLLFLQAPRTLYIYREKRDELEILRCMKKKQKNNGCTYRDKRDTQHAELVARVGSIRLEHVNG